MVKVKICGITSKEDALAAAKLGAYAVGFIFYKKSPRFISPSKARKIVEALPPFVVPVGVFVNQSERAIKDIARFCGINTLQLHGDETPQTCGRLKEYKLIKAFRVNESFDAAKLKEFKVSAFLFDTYKEGGYGGTGETFDWGIVREFKSFQTPIILSGGINPQNIREASERVMPYAVDVSSGVEIKPGIKDHQLLKELFEKIQILN